MINETGVYFFPGGGHDHDGESASLIDTNSYSIFDFPWTTEIGGPDRKRRLENNYNSFKNFIITTVNDSIIRPAGIFFQPGSINASSDIITNSITTNLIQAGAITADLIQAGTITADLIAANAITANEIAAGAITANEIAANTITANEISAAYVYTGNLSADQISTGSLSADFISGGSISADLISGGSISADLISGGSISADLISGGSISADLIIGGVIDASDIYGVNITGVSITGSSIAVGDRILLPVDGGQILLGTASGGSVTQCYVFAGGSQGLYIDTSGSGSTWIAGQSLYVNLTQFTSVRQIIGLQTFTGSGAPLSVLNGEVIRQTSKRELKENIQDFNNISLIDKLRPRTFNWKRNPALFKEETPEEELRRESSIDIGFIAEEVAEASDGMLSIYNYEEGGNGEVTMYKHLDILALSVANIQDLRRRIAVLEQQLGYNS